MKEGQPDTIRLDEYEVPPFLIEETKLHVDIQENVTRVTTILKVIRNPESKGDNPDLQLDGGPGLDTKSIAVDGRKLLSNEYRIDNDELNVHDVPDSFELKTVVDIKPQDNTALEGLYLSGDMFCTQCEAQGFRHITWYADRPDVMSKYQTTIVADKKSCPVLLSNGNAIDRGEEGDRHWVTWEDPFKKPAYLFALVAGDLEHTEDKFITMSGREVTLQIFTESHNIDKVDYAMESLKNSMAWDEAAYGREYDLDIFMIVAVESFNMGAMENKGLNIFNTSCVLARPDTTTDAGYQRVESVVAHEYFHNWSGNRVTCRDWFQLSLKEGFTVLRDQQFSAYMGSPTVCRVNDVAVLRSAQFPEDAGPMAHPIRPDSYIEINNFYTATVYEKGAEVVGMIRTMLGAENFRKGTDLYFDRHDGQAVTTEDFVVAMENANDVDLSQFRHWYRQAGTPIVEISASFNKTERTYTLDVRQSCPPTPGQEQKDPFHIPMSIGLLGVSGEDLALELASDDGNVIALSPVHTDSTQTRVLHITKASQSFTFNNIDEAPVPSLFRGFSAPVKVEYDYSRDELMFLMSHDSDGFNRWEAGQRLAVDIIQELVGCIQNGIEPVVDKRLIEAFDSILSEAIEHDRDSSIDKAMIANMLVLPAESYLAELVEVADVDAIHQARNVVRSELASRLKGVLLSVYKLNQDAAAYQLTGDAIAKRALKNVALSYLMQSDDASFVKLCAEQFYQSDNMTDTSAAIRALVNSQVDEAAGETEKALIEFYNRWSDEALVIDQWFAIQATSTNPGTLDKVKALMKHPAFDMKNPNRMRSLVAAFSSQNIVNFHCLNGEGYRFLADCVIELNDTNPQMAARMLSPLTRWRKYDEQRQSMMKSELNRILSTENLSGNVFEIASKSI